jgi:rare lipoprotein A
MHDDIRGVRRNTLSRLVRLTAIAMITLAGPFMSGLASEAKTPGHTYCFNHVCHRVKTINETREAIGETAVVKASFYDSPGRDGLNPSHITSSGEFLAAQKPDNAASPVYPDGTKVLVWNPRTRKAAVVRINNAGPYYGSRLLDVSRAAAERLGFANQGVATLHVCVVEAPTDTDTRYRRGRTYTPVAGFLGVFQSLDMAMADLGRAINGVFAPSPVTVASDPTRREGAVPATPQPIKETPTSEMASAVARAPVSNGEAKLAGGTPKAAAKKLTAAVQPFRGPKFVAKAKTGHRKSLSLAQAEISDDDDQVKRPSKVALSNRPRRVAALTGEDSNLSPNSPWER